MNYDHEINAIRNGHVVSVRHEHAADALDAVSATDLECHAVLVGNADPRMELRPGPAPEPRDQPLSKDHRDTSLPAPIRGY